MSKVTISKAAKLVGISRSYFYSKYINTGLISISNESDKKLIDISELIRVFGRIKVEYSIEDNINTQVDNPKTEDKLTDMLERQIIKLEKQLEEAREREKWLQEKIDKATLLLEDKTKKKKFWVC